MRTLFVLLMALGASAQAAELVKRELPTFFIDLPDGEITKQGTHPGAGAMVMMLNKPESMKQMLESHNPDDLLAPGARQLHVQWDGYVIRTEEDRKLLVNTVIQALPFEAQMLREKVLTDDRRLYVLGNPSLPIAFVFVPCKPDLGVTMTVAFTRNLDDLVTGTERLARSVVCKENIGPVQQLQPAMRLPKNFGRKIEDNVNLYLSLDGEMLAVVLAPQDIQRYPAMYKQVMTALFANVLEIPAEKMSIEVIDTNKVDGASAQIAVMRTQGEMDGAYLRARYCKAHDLTLFVLWYVEGGTEPRARERFGQVGCPGEPDEPVADMAELFSAACKKDNALACAILENLSSP